MSAGSGYEAQPIDIKTDPPLLQSEFRMGIDETWID